ncbi:MAG: DUF2165 family protein [Pseudomonadota bacterium]
MCSGCWRSPAPSDCAASEGAGEHFQRGMRTVKTACMLGFFVYGFLFFTVGGDWFLAWQNPDLIGLQKDAVNYGLMVVLTYVLLDSRTQRT